jgi:hypothetical protein
MSLEFLSFLPSCRCLLYCAHANLVGSFEAEVHFPEEEGIVQIEHFGVHCRDDGTVLYGLTIEAILDNNRVSLALLVKFIFS